MYSWEIQKLLEVKNFLLSNEEYFNLFNTCPQINYIEYLPWENNFHMTTDDRYDFKFKVYKKEKSDKKD